MANDAFGVIIGNITNEPKLIHGKNGDFASFSVAVSTMNKDESGNYKTNFYSCNAYGNVCETIMERCMKGTQLAVYGDISLVDYKKKDGTVGQSLNMFSYKVRLLQRYKGAEDKTVVRSNNTTNYDKPVNREMEEVVDDSMPF